MKFPFKRSPSQSTTSKEARSGQAYDDDGDGDAEQQQRLDIISDRLLPSIFTSSRIDIPSSYPPPPPTAPVGDIIIRSDTPPKMTMSKSKSMKDLKEQSDTIHDNDNNPRIRKLSTRERLFRSVSKSSLKRAFSSPAIAVAAADDKKSMPSPFPSSSSTKTPTPSHKQAQEEQLDTSGTHSPFIPSSSTTRIRRKSLKELFTSFPSSSSSSKGWKPSSQADQIIIGSPPFHSNSHFQVSQSPSSISPSASASPSDSAAVFSEQSRTRLSSSASFPNISNNTQLRSPVGTGAKDSLWSTGSRLRRLSASSRSNSSQRPGEESLSLSASISDHLVPPVPVVPAHHLVPASRPVSRTPSSTSVSTTAISSSVQEVAADTTTEVLHSPNTPILITPEASPSLSSPYDHTLTTTPSETLSNTSPSTPSTSTLATPATPADGEARTFSCYSLKGERELVDGDSHPYKSLVSGKALLLASPVRLLYEKRHMSNNPISGVNLPLSNILPSSVQAPNVSPLKIAFPSRPDSAVNENIATVDKSDTASRSDPRRDIENGGIKSSASLSSLSPLDEQSLTFQPSRTSLAGIIGSEVPQPEPMIVSSEMLWHQQPHSKASNSNEGSTILSSTTFDPLDASMVTKFADLIVRDLQSSATWLSNNRPSLNDQSTDDGYGSDGDAGARSTESDEYSGSSNLSHNDGGFDDTDTSRKDGLVGLDTHNQLDLPDILDGLAIQEPYEAQLKQVTTPSGSDSAILPPASAAATCEPVSKVNLCVDTSLTASASSRRTSAYFNATSKSPLSPISDLVLPAQVSARLTHSPVDACNNSLHPQQQTHLSPASAIAKSPSSYSPRGWSIGARLCADFTLNRLKEETMMSASAQPERINMLHLGGAPYPSSTCSLRSLPQGGKRQQQQRPTPAGFRQHLAWQGCLRKLQARTRITLLEELELDGFKGLHTSPAASPSQAGFVIPPTAESIAPQNERNFARENPDTNHKWPSSPFSLSGQGVVSLPSSRLAPLSFMEAQQRAWASWINRKAFQERVQITTPSGSQNHLETRFNAKSTLHLSDRAQVWAAPLLHITGYKPGNPMAAGTGPTGGGKFEHQDVISVRHPKEGAGALMYVATANSLREHTLASHSHLTFSNRANSVTVTSPANSSSEESRMLGSKKSEDTNKMNPNNKTVFGTGWMTKLGFRSGSKKRGSGPLVAEEELRGRQGQRARISRESSTSPHSGDTAPTSTSTSTPATSKTSSACSGQSDKALRDNVPHFGFDRAPPRPSREEAPDVAKRLSLAVNNIGKLAPVVSANQTVFQDMPSTRPRLRVLSHDSDTVSLRPHTMHIAGEVITHLETRPAREEGPVTGRRPFSQVIQSGKKYGLDDSSVLQTPSNPASRSMERDQSAHRRISSFPERDTRSPHGRSVSFSEKVNSTSMDDDEVPLAAIRANQNRTSQYGSVTKNNGKTNPNAVLAAPIPRRKGPDARPTSVRFSTMLERPEAIKHYEDKLKAQILDDQSKRDNEAGEVKRKRDERKQWEDHRRKSTYLEDQAAAAEKAAAETARRQSHLFAHAQMMMPQPMYPVAAPFVHPAFQASLQQGYAPAYMAFPNNGSQYPIFAPQTYNYDSVKQSASFTPPATPLRYPSPGRSSPTSSAGSPSRSHSNRHSMYANLENPIVHSREQSPSRSITQQRESRGGSTPPGIIPRGQSMPVLPVSSSGASKNMFRQSMTLQKPSVPWNRRSSSYEGGTSQVSRK